MKNCKRSINNKKTDSIALKSEIEGIVFDNEKKEKFIAKTLQKKKRKYSV